MSKIVVTGASGNVGRELVRLLANAGQQVSAVARRAPELAGWVSPATLAVSSHAADLGRAEDWQAILSGADAVFLLVAGDAPTRLLEVAAKCGVGHVVLLSTQGAGTRPDFYVHARSFENAVRDSGLAWTILRPSGYAVNAMMWAESVRADRVVAAPFGDVSLPVIDPDDIAAVAASVLLAGGHVGEIVTLTGPAAISPRDQTAAISAAIGVPVRFVELTREQALVGMMQVMPETIAEGTLGILGSPLQAEERVSDGVERVLGRPATGFEAWAERHAAAFR